LLPERALAGFLSAAVLRADLDLADVDLTGTAFAGRLATRVFLAAFDETLLESSCGIEVVI